MRSRRRTSELKRNAKFLSGIVAVSAVVGIGIAVSTQGLDTMMHRISLGLKAMGDPTQLSAEEKAEVRKLVKDKASAMKQYESLAPDQKE